MYSIPPDSKKAAILNLETQLALGKQLLSRVIRNNAELIEANAERSAWSLYNKKVLKQIFGEAATGLASLGLAATTAEQENAEEGGWHQPTLQDDIRAFQGAMVTQITHLDKVTRLLAQLG